MTLIDEVKTTLLDIGKKERAEELLKVKHQMKDLMLKQGWTVEYIMGN